MKKIYYSASVQGIKHIDPNFGWELVQYMKSLGFNVLSEHVAGRTYAENVELFEKNTGKIISNIANPEKIKYAVNMEMVDNCEYLVAIVDGPSIGVGMELMRALLKPRCGLNLTNIKCLVQTENYEKLTLMIKGVPIDEYPNFSISTYSDLNSAKHIVKDFLSEN